MQMALDFDGEQTEMPVLGVGAMPVDEASHLAGLAEATKGESGGSMLLADEDHAAIEAWIAARCDEPIDQSRRPSHTARAYRREACRFLSWLRIERGVDLAGARLEDAVAYKKFLSDPQPRDRWCGPRGAAIGAAEWRPFVGPLCARSRRHAMVILTGLYRFLQDQSYLTGNPWSGVAPPRMSAPRIDSGRSLSARQWKAVEAELNVAPQSFRDRQLAWVVRLLYATGLRLAEVVGADCSDLEWRELDPFDPGSAGATDEVRPGCWVLTVLGKGQKPREIPVPGVLADEMEDLLAAWSRTNGPMDHAARPLLLASPGRSEVPSVRPYPRLSAQALYRQLKCLFRRVSQRLVKDGRVDDARVLLRASTHWLRHTHGTHALALGTPLDVVQQGMGHASLATTTVYVRGEMGRRAREAARLHDGMSPSSARAISA
ncbi:tyrosine-type recombinase/integrase [Sphaerotilaceae bacterium SBD11-9]